MITTIARTLCSTALALAALTASTAAQDLDGRWFKVTFQARLATSVEIAEFGDDPVVTPKAKIKSVKSGMYVQLHYDEPSELGGELYRADLYVDTPEGLMALGDSELTIVGGTFSDLELFVYDLGVKDGEVIPKAMVAARLSGKIDRKTDGEGTVTKASMTSLGGVVEEAVVIGKTGETACYAVGGARIKARLLPEKKVAQLPPVIVF